MAATSRCRPHATCAGEAALRRTAVKHTRHPLITHSSSTHHPLIILSSPTHHPLITHSSSSHHPLIILSSPTQGALATDGGEVDVMGILPLLREGKTTILAMYGS